jgi:hypothetical protein
MSIPLIRRRAAGISGLILAGALVLSACSSTGQTGEPAEVVVTITTTQPGTTADSRSTHPDGSTAHDPGTTSDVVTDTSRSPESTTDANPTTSAVTTTSTSTSATTSTPTGASKPPVDTSKDTVVWDDNSMVPHLFFHSLIVDPERAFNDAESGAGYLDYMVTQREFAKILQQVYDNDYVLVSPHQLATVADDGSIKPKKLKLPQGKKPLVISVDDVSYYEYMEGDGFASKLTIADDGRVVNTYTDADGKTTQGSYDVMPMVDDFIREHPDFSHAGARGVIALTGYNGVLGYRSSPSEYRGKNKNLEKDIATAKRVADALKAEGWEFASHSWGHINFTTSSLDRIQRDTELWKSDVEPIVGKTDLLIYPFGADISGVPHYQGPKYDYLKGQGYSFFFNVDGSTTAWGQWGDGYLREARINVDGISMKAAVNGRKVLDAFFDVTSVLDPARPASISGS